MSAESNNNPPTDPYRPPQEKPKKGNGPDAPSTPLPPERT